MSPTPPYRVLFVCLGNICRSPTAEAALRHRLGQEGLADRVEVDSAGTTAWNVGSAPDRRMAAAAAQRGITIDGTARQVTVDDFITFDLIVAMDRRNRDDLVHGVAPDTEAARRVRLFREFEDRPDGPDVPDPYGGGRDGFDHVVDIVVNGAEGLTAFIRDRIDLPATGPGGVWSDGGRAGPNDHTAGADDKE